MTANVNSLRGDLHLAVSTAFNRGRYTLTTAGGDGQPVEITLDLRERPDDLFEREPQDWVSDLSPGRLNAAPRREDIGKWRPFTTDDHGPAIPAQGELHRSAEIVGVEDGPSGPWAVREPGPSVYEFALQDYWAANEEVVENLADVRLEDAPDLDAAYAADWVHVYDRVTRERRTLKRPEPDAVLTGLRDVAADLRKPKTAEPDPGFVADRILTESGAYIHVNRPADAPMKGAPVEPPFGCAPLPPVGPLTSTEGLRAGDVLFSADKDFGVVTFDGWARGRSIGVRHLTIPERGLTSDFSGFRFVGRPDSEGWMAWAGGENPVPGATVDVEFQEHAVGSPCIVAADEIEPNLWRHDNPKAVSNIVAFRIVDSPPAV